MLFFLASWRVRSYIKMLLTPTDRLQFNFSIPKGHGKSGSHPAPSSLFTRMMYVWKQREEGRRRRSE
ncbi:hypothetical protein EUGRSUZ_J00775 [Eucalyptus grandis]|uniref:Uncharacterized protein n=2 Tax=Eucalyptus grandis TaxID=71139 RepID=A0ACC3J2Y1_EUCGR|nr:hypothetical protein EUGRSUZ_J00775 [Eucalyptus grandis]